jgi:tetratricopeptide (TPR) repeat protein
MRGLTWAGAGLALLGAALWATGAQARNEHCAGGIQYVVQGMRDKDRGNLEDYQREMGKAIQQLIVCSQEDPADFEALGYLGWAYAEVDSAEAAGTAFQKAIQGLAAKGDKKKLETVSNNRDSYYARYFNTGIERITAAQTAYPDMSRKPENPTDETLRNEALKAYQASIANLRKALLLKPGDARTFHNLGAVYTFMGEHQEAEKVFREGLAAAPQDSVLKRDLATVRVSVAQGLVDDKKYDEAIATFTQIVADEPDNLNALLLLADANFRKAQAASGDERAKSFHAAGETYAKASELRPNDPDAAFNAGSAYTAAGECAKAEPFWRKSLSLRPEDVDAMSSLGACLSELGRFRESIEVLQKAVAAKPREQNLHRQLGAVYTKAGKDTRGTQELMLYLALKNGQKAADAKAQAEAAAKKQPDSDAAVVFGKLGAPEEVLLWNAEGISSETWLYWSKSMAYTFANGKLTAKTDWTTPDLDGLPAQGAAKPAGKK